MYYGQNNVDESPKILLYGYGNPGRKDDGLGPVLVDEIEQWIIRQGIRNVSVDSNYQLNIEDAYTIQDYDIILFMDASIEDIDEYIITRVIPSDKVNYTMHSVSPSFVLHLCNTIYRKVPSTFLLHIKGYAFDLQEGLTDGARKNMEAASDFLKGLLQDQDRLLDNIEPFCSINGFTG